MPRRSALAWICPALSAKQWLTIAVSTLLGTLLAGGYGAIHDQLTYSISPEYFESMKYPQFNAREWPITGRWRVAGIGFLGSWWLGASIGVLIARVSIASFAKSDACRRFAEALTLVMLSTLVAGGIGALGPYLESPEARKATMQEWSDYQVIYDLIDLPAFVQVAEIHRASYIGAAIGLLLAMSYLALRIIWPKRPQKAGAALRVPR